MDTNRIITIEELETGDEILISSGGNFRYYKILRKPMINKRTGRYMAVRCSTNIKIIPMTRSWGTVRDYTIEMYNPTAEGHNTQKSVNLRWRKIWLVKREEG